MVIKTTILLAAAYCASRALRNRSAAVRHAVWTAALAAALALPFWPSFAPTWQPPVADLPVLAATTVVAAEARTASEAAPLPWLAILYAIGAAVAVARFAAGAWRVSSWIRRGSVANLPAGPGIRVVTSPAAPMPMAWGILRRTILLPTSALSWPEPQLRAVLLHEATHHRRRDLLTQAIAQAACCVWWFHPLAWLALARQRQEREIACDDAVLRSGIRPHEYASSLVEVVRSVAGTRANWSGAPAMAEASGLETRVRAVLDPAVDRRPVTRRSAAVVALIAAALLAPLATVELRAQGGGTIAGVVHDASGARVPNVTVTARNLSGANQEITSADSAGEYRFASIPPGQYALEFSARGFATRKSNADLVTGGVVRVDASLEVGQILESVTVSGKRPTTVATPRATRAPGRVRVGGNVTPVRLLHQARPVYSPELQQAGLEGTVMLRAIISKTGTVLQLQVINSVDSRLANAAVQAVSQWQYQPALLNGEPIEVQTTVNIEFKLE
jgi:TonB family protein